MNKTGYLEAAMEWLLNHPEGEAEEEGENEEGQAHDMFSRIFPITNLRIFSLIFLN